MIRDDNEWCDSETGTKLQKLGCPFYNKYISGAPMIHLWDALKFLRVEKHIYIEVGHRLVDDKDIYILYICDRKECLFVAYDFNTYEDALLAGIIKTIKMLEVCL